MLIFLGIFYLIIFALFMINSIMEYEGKLTGQRMALITLMSVCWPVTMLIVASQVYITKNRNKAEQS